MSIVSNIGNNDVLYGNVDSVFYDSYGITDDIPYDERMILSGYPYKFDWEIIDTIFDSSENECNLYKTLYRKDNSLELPIIRLSKDEYLINPELGYPRHLYAALKFILEKLDSYEHMKSYQTTEKAKTFEDMSELVGDFHMEDLKDLLCSEVYRKFEEAVSDLDRSDKILSFVRFLYVIALKNVHMTHPPGYEAKMRRYIDNLRCWKWSGTRDILRTAILYSKANEIECGDFIKYNNCFYSMLEKPDSMSGHEYTYLNWTGGAMPLMREFIDGFFKSSEDEYEKYGVKFRKDCSIDVPIKHIEDYNFLINTDIDCPRCLYDVLLSLEFIGRLRFGIPHIIIPVDEIREITEGLYVDSLEDLFESEAFRKLNKLTENMEYYNEVHTFKIFLCMVALNNSHLIADPRIRK